MSAGGAPLPSKNSCAQPGAHFCAAPLPATLDKASLHRKLEPSTAQRLLGRGMGLPSGAPVCQQRQHECL